MRHCPFCPSRADSGEHVYPQWVTRRYLEGASRRAHFSMQFGGLLPDREARTLNQTVKVCSDCNSGWMSRLENAARPVLEEVIEGRPGTLGETDQNVLARWLCKNAILHDWLLPRTRRVARPDQRSGLAEGQVPYGWEVRLGAMDQEGPSTWRHTVGNPVVWQKEDGSRRCQLHTTVWHRMLAQVVLHNLDVAPEFDALLGGDEWSVQIAPETGPQSWPPPRRFLSEWVEIVAHPSVS